ncbi:cell division protein FtsW [Candidatus Woesebacteria bacterium]|nr:cell division protein FtsW [Candidatus Woesebacteria bacterium]
MTKKRTSQTFRFFNRWQSLFLGILLLLLGLGLLFMLDISVVESATTFHDPYYLLKQFAFGLGLSSVFFTAGLLVPTKYWIRFGGVLYILGILSLLLVFVPGIGLELNGANRWFAIGSFRFQPVEFVKIALIMYFSQWLAKHQQISSFLLVLAAPAVLLLLQPDLGSLLLVIGIALLLFFLAGGKIQKLALLSLVGVPVLLVLIITSPYRLQRLTSFLNPESDPLGASFHIHQISLALGRGGLWGQGLGNSHQKFAYIPESTTDSIFAIIAEEIGYVGCIVLIGLFLLLFYAGYRTIAESESSTSERLLGFGMLSWIALQTSLNLAAVVGLVPLTGIPLPFFSYGRSSQVMTMLACAIILRTGSNSST